MATEIEDLQSRVTHQEASIEELTRAQVVQESRLRELERQLEQFRILLRAVYEQSGEPPVEDTPPPHY
jgi:uncharacterized coiled-coil protein SlyX